MRVKKFAVIAFLLIFILSLQSSVFAEDMSIQYEFPDGYTVNNWYSNRVQVQGGASPYTFNITSGTLPPGFYIRQDGTYFYLEGIPNKAGTYTFNLSVRDNNDSRVEKQLSVKVNNTHYADSNMSLLYSFDTNKDASLWYSSRVQVQGGVSAYTFKITSGALPSGLYIRQDGNNFYLEGYPTKAGSYNFTLRVIDQHNGYVEKSFTVALTGTPIAPNKATDMSITGDFMSGRAVNESYSSYVSIKGVSGSARLSVVSGTLPPGLSLSNGNSTSIWLKGVPNTWRYLFIYCKSY